MRFLQFALGYSDTLFKEDESEKFGLVIFEVVKHVGSFGINGKTALSLQAIHYFEEVANDSNKADIFRPFAEKVFEQLIEFAKNIPHYEFYKMIVNFLKYSYLSFCNAVKKLKLGCIGKIMAAINH